MSRVRTLFAVVVPSVIAGGLLFAGVPGYAETSRDDGPAFWSAASDAAPVVVAQAEPRPRPRGWAPAPPAPPAPPSPPAVPLPPRVRGKHGVSVSIHDGKIQIGGLAELVEAQLDGILTMLDHLPNVPPDVRDRVKGRVKAVRGKLVNRLGRLKALDVDQLGDEMERLGDEIEKEMEGLDKDLAKLGDQLGQDFARQFGQVGQDLARQFGQDFVKQFGRDMSRSFSARIDHDDDDDDDGDDEDELADAEDLAPPDLGPAIADLKNKGLTLDAGQRQRLQRLSADARRQIEEAKRELDDQSNKLHSLLRDPSVKEGQIERQIDAISGIEARIRKAEILTWVKVRGVLRPDQRAQVEAAVKKHR